MSLGLKKSVASSKELAARSAIAGGFADGPERYCWELGTGGATAGRGELALEHGSSLGVGTVTQTSH